MDKERAFLGKGESMFQKSPLFQNYWSVGVDEGRESGRQSLRGGQRLGDEKGRVAERRESRIGSNRPGLNAIATG